MAEEKLQRNTRQRQVILEELCKVTSHPTAAELFALVQMRLPRISLGTVYRNLELLVQNDIIRKLELGGREARYDGNLNRHYHIRCMECGRVADLHDISDDPVAAKLENVEGWEIMGHRLEFIGICPQCRGEKAEKEIK
ncbi:MAG: transcriptional repressor [candidate division Zixibacteria bacterium]|nr:transcriptional repressor [candidate division Zixibacteria bacterium]